jgi:hypothetical protein
MLGTLSVQTLYWESADAVPQAVEKRMAKLSVSKGEWGYPAQNKVAEWSALIIEEELRINIEQVLSMRYQLLVEKQSRRHKILHRKRRMCVQQYEEGTSLLSLSRTYDFSPCSLFRAILSGGINPMLFSQDFIFASNRA